MPSEQDIQKKILDYLASIDAYAIKVITSNRRGVADILACHKGQFYAIEVKTQQGRVSPLQMWHRTRATEAGAVAFIARSLDDVKKKIKE